MNKIGIIADSHDRQSLLKKAVERLNTMEVDMVLHAGDIVAPFSAKHLGGLHMPFRCVFGNNDGERKLLGRVVEDQGGEIDDFLEFELSGKSIAIYHGTDSRILDAIAGSQRYSLVGTGHTHSSRIKAIGETLVVNPGEVCGYLTGECTMALVELEKGEAEIVPIDC